MALYYWRRSSQLQRMLSIIDDRALNGDGWLYYWRRSSQRRRMALYYQQRSSQRRRLALLSVTELSMATDGSLLSATELLSQWRRSSQWIGDGALISTATELSMD